MPAFRLRPAGPVAAEISYSACVPVHLAARENPARQLCSSPVRGLTLRSAPTRYGGPSCPCGALVYPAPHGQAVPPPRSVLAQTLGRTQRASETVAPQPSNMPAAFQVLQPPERAPVSCHGARSESELRRQQFALPRALAQNGLPLRFAGAALHSPAARFSQFVGPPPCLHSCCGLLGRWRRKSTTALARRCTSPGVKTRRTNSAALRCAA